MAMAGLRPVVAIYSTFLSRAFDQANLDVGLHGQPVVFALDRAGLTGDNGPSHHGVLDPARELSGPASIRYPSGTARSVPADQVGTGLSARRLRAGDGSVCVLAVGKMLEAAEEAADILAADGIEATV